MLFLRCFCRFYVFLPWDIVFGGSGRSRALLAVLWLGGLFYGGMSLLCRCLRALCVVPLVYFFYLSFYRCLAVAGFAFVVRGIVLCVVPDVICFFQHFCVNRCFSCLDDFFSFF